MVEKYYTVRGNKINLRSIDDVLVVRYKKSLGDIAMRSTFLGKPYAEVQGVDTKTYPKYNIALISRPLSEQIARREEFSRAVTKHDNVQFVSNAFRESSTGSMMLVTEEINLRFKAGITKQTMEKIISDYSLTIVKEYKFSLGQYVVRVSNANSDKTLDTANILASLPEVELSEPNFICEVRKAMSISPNEKYFAQQWHLNNTGQADGVIGEDVRALEAWQLSAGGSSTIVIAILDDGVDIEHPDLKENIWENPDSAAQDRHGRNFVDDTNDPSPIHFAPPFDDLSTNDIHGTSCAGVAAASGKQASGIAYNCKILGLKVLGGDSPGKLDTLVEAIKYAGIHADIISISLGWPPSEAIATAINEVVTSGRGGKGCPVFAATGNQGTSVVSFIASLSETIAVGASTNKGTRSPDSQYGKEIDFLAPSSGGTKAIFTTDVSIPTRGFNLGTADQGDLEGLYTNRFGGTSSATPLAAGVAALVLSINPSLNAEDIRLILRQSCDKIDSNTAKYDSNGFSIYNGFGRINARRALELAKQTLNP